MIFNKLIAQGFKSASKPMIMHFGNYEGTCFVTGDNQAEPHLGSNGAGKSTVWDAICWCLYGKDTKMFKAGHIVNWWSDEPCVVTLEMELNSKSYTVIRTQWPNSLSVNGEEQRQDQVEELLGLNYQSFIHLVIIPQFSSKFFELQPADKLQIFSSILNLDKWLDSSAKAKLKADAAFKEMNSVTSAVTRLEGQIEQSEEDILSLVSKGIGWAAQQEEKKETTRKSIDENQSSRNFWNEGLVSVEEELAPVLNKYKILVQKDQQLSSEQVGAATELKNREKQVDTIQFSLKNLKKEYKDYEKLEGVCPHCDQQITAQYLESKLNIIQEKVDRANELVEKQEQKVFESENDYNSIKERRNELVESMKKLESATIELTKNKNSFESKLSNADSVLEMLEDELSGLENAECPFTLMQEETKEKVKTLKKDRRIKKREIKNLNIEYNLYKYWIKGFKEVRLFVIEEALLEFQLQINNNLVKLGLQDWEVILAVDSMTKEGNVRKGFTVWVKSPHNEDLVPFRCYSGGEGARLKVAGIIGLAEFITNRTGINPNIEVWDEATSWMSNEGVKDLVELLSERAEDTNKTIYMIDHRDLNTFGEFTSGLHIIKDEEGSRVA